MPGRNRNRTWGQTTGTSKNFFTGVTSTTVTDLGYSFCSDIVRNRLSDNALYIEHRGHEQLGTVTGVDSVSAPLFQWNRIPHGSQSPPNHVTLSSTPPSNLAASTLGAARTNPGRPVVSVPVFVGELKDSILSLFELGNAKVHKKRHRGNSVAAQNFGWDPLFRDVAALFQFQEHVNNRVKELTALHSKSGLKRNWTTWEAQADVVDPTNTVVWSSGGTWVETRVRRSTKARQWVSTRWRPKIDKLPPNADQLMQQAKLAVHGWRLSPADAWELMPWSWFIDYFVNVGDFLQATSNSAEFRLESVCVMKQMTTRQTHSIVVKSGPISVVPGRQLFETKERAVGSLGITATQPFLSAKQIVTLAGIAANR